METEKKRYHLYKKIIAALFAVMLFYLGLKDYACVNNSDIAVAELYGNYPTVDQAQQLWENYQKGDDITDVCFLWNGGIQEVENPQYSRQTNVRVTGVTGMAELYDRAAALLAGNDENGCVIDKDTALELFGSENCVGSEVTVGEETYQVRGVAAWSQHMLLIRPAKKDLTCTQVLIRSKKGQSLESTATSFLMGNGLSGTLVDDSWGDVILPWFPTAFLIMFATAVSRWTGRFEKRIGKNGDFQRYSCLIFRMAIWGICLFFSIRLLEGIPISWLPDKWSDFSFWPSKLKKTMEAFQWYIMFPKTMAQAGRLISGIGCMIKCGAAALLLGAV